jgi:phage-related protein
MKVLIEVVAHGRVEVDTTSEDYRAMRAQLSKGEVNLDNFASEHCLERDLLWQLAYAAKSVMVVKPFRPATKTKRGKFVK